MKRFVIILILCTVFLSGCTSQAILNLDNNITPNIVACGVVNTLKDGGQYFYIIDKNTGVVYLAFQGDRRCGISVMLNADGTPVTAEQLGIKID